MATHMPVRWAACRTRKAPKVRPDATVHPQSTLPLHSYPGSHSHHQESAHHLSVRVRDALQLKVHRVEVRKLPLQLFLAGEGLVRVVSRLGGDGGGMGRGGHALRLRDFQWAKRPACGIPLFRDLSV